jgi:hypothetical protein
VRPQPPLHIEHLMGRDLPSTVSTCRRRRPNRYVSYQPTATSPSTSARSERGSASSTATQACRPNIAVTYSRTLIKPIPFIRLGIGSGSETGDALALDGTMPAVIRPLGATRSSPPPAFRRRRRDGMASAAARAAWIALKMRIRSIASGVSRSPMQRTSTRSARLSRGPSASHGSIAAEPAHCIASARGQRGRAAGDVASPGRHRFRAGLAGLHRPAQVPSLGNENRWRHRCCRSMKVQRHVCSTLGGMFTGAATEAEGHANRGNCRPTDPVGNTESPELRDAQQEC